jgi:type I restriction enzyme R subunit
VSPPPSSPEQKAREKIDAALVEAGWVVQDRADMNLSAGRGVAVREFKLTAGHGFADYMLFVDGKAVGVLEAKPEGYTLSGVEVQASRYSQGLPAGLDPPRRAAAVPLPLHGIGHEVHEPPRSRPAQPPRLSGSPAGNAR